jgi:phosphatidate cytidylyltransferase
MKTSVLNKYNNLTQRVIVALIGVAVLISAIVYSQYSYLVVFAIILFFTISEFYKLLLLDGMLPLKFWGTFTAVILFFVTFLVQSGIEQSRLYFILFPVSAIVFFIKLYKRGENKPFTNIAYTFLGIIYVGVPFALLHTIAFRDGIYNYEVIIGILLMTWASDTGAYFAGTTFGKKKLFERVSPNKSWEGFIGGALLTIVLSIVISHYFNTLELWKWLVIGILTTVAGTYGDLVESLFKRSIEIKDSGTSLPGHGGFLDRFDALLLSIPFIAAFLALFQ